MSARYRLWPSLLANYPLLAAALHTGMRSACRGCGPATSFCNESFQAIVKFLTCAARIRQFAGPQTQLFLASRCPSLSRQPGDQGVVARGEERCFGVNFGVGFADIEDSINAPPPEADNIAVPSSEKRCHRGIKVSLHYVSGLRDPSFLSTEKLQSTEVLLRRLSGGLLSTDTDHLRTLLPPARLLKY